MLKNIVIIQTICPIWFCVTFYDVEFPLYVFVNWAYENSYDKVHVEEWHSYYVFLVIFDEIFQCISIFPLRTPRNTNNITECNHSNDNRKFIHVLYIL